MFDLGKLIFEETFQIVGQVNQAEASSFVAQKKREGQLASTVADFAEKLASEIEKQSLTAEQQQKIVLACAAALKPLADDPQALTEAVESSQEQGLPENIDEELRLAYTFVFSRLAGFLASQADAPATEKSAQSTPKNISRSATKPISDNFSFEVDVAPNAGESADEPVSFTAMYPREVGAEIWNTLLVYTHLASALETIQKDARRFKDQLGDSKEVTAPASTPLARGTELTIVPQCDGVTFNPKRITISWLEDFHRTEFRFRADRSLADDAAKGRIDIYVGPLIVGTLKFGLLVGENAPQSAAPQEAEHANMYQQDDIFISYSHRDTEVVLAFKKAYEAIGNNVLIDIDTLRSGQDWNAELMRMIDRAEIFQLFWSENTSQSKYCREEWEYALKLNRELGFIRPCYWTQPMPNPPAELGHLHFEYVQV